MRNNAVLSDEALVKLAFHGDKSAAAVIVSRYYDDILRYVSYRVNGSDSAYDITQNAFMNFCSHLHEAEIKYAKAYLYKMAQNAVTDYYRLHAKTECCELNDDISCVDDFVSEVTEREHVRRAVSKLPEEQKETVILYYLCDLTVKEIARAKDIPVATVKSRLRLGKIKLRKILEGSGSY